tara:strand:+ start:203 stop:493 length:291 start_codon:yes stop_codon:yes gene_type:complete
MPHTFGEPPKEDSVFFKYAAVYLAFGLLYASAVKEIDKHRCLESNPAFVEAGFTQDNTSLYTWMIPTWPYYATGIVTNQLLYGGLQNWCEPGVDNE